MEGPVLAGLITYNAGFPGPRTEMDPNQLFYRHFEAEVTGESICFLFSNCHDIWTNWFIPALQDEIANLSNISAAGGERKDATDHILTGMSRLNNEVLDVSDRVPPRDQKMYIEVWPPTSPDTDFHGPPSHMTDRHSKL